MSIQRERSYSGDTDLQITFRRYFPALWKFLWRNDADILFDGFTLKRWQGGYMVVIRAEEFASNRRLVCFGSAPTVFDAIRNASLAVSKGQWRPDKFQGK